MNFDPRRSKYGDYWDESDEADNSHAEHIEHIQDYALQEGLALKEAERMFEENK